MSVAEGFKGAAVEFSRLQSPAAKVKYIIKTARLIVEEVSGTLALVPFGLRAMRTHRRLSATASKSEEGVQLRADVRYGDAPRNVMDIYIPGDTCVSSSQRLVTVQGPSAPGHSSTAASQHASNRGAAERSAVADSDQRHPVVLFVHGGVWASGSKWHYSQLGSKMAQNGIVTCVMEYSLYPSVQADCMVREVSDGLTWLLDNIHRHGGNPSNVTVLAHSAGAHLACMALLHRARAATLGSQAATDQMQQEGRDRGGLCTCDGRMPARAVLMAGCYDIQKHYEFEERRGVHYLSTMERAMGGWHAFPPRSPNRIIFSAAARRHGQEPDAKSEVPSRDVASGREADYATLARCNVSEASTSASSSGDTTLEVLPRPGSTRGDGRQAVVDLDNYFRRSLRLLFGASTAAESSDGKQWGHLDPPDRSRYYNRFALAGDAIAARIGHNAAPSANGNMPGTLPFSLDSGDPAERLAACITSVELQRLPPTAFVSSAADLTVPWHEGAEMFRTLSDAGVPARHLVYDYIGHGDFVTSWRCSDGESQPVGQRDHPALQMQGDLLCLAKGSVRISTPA